MLASLPQTHAATRQETIDVVRLGIGEVDFALPLAAVATILSPAAIVRRDDRLGWIGVVPSRGGEIPIADGRAIFGLDTPASTDQRLLILRGRPATGLLVDAIHGTSTVDTANIEWHSPLFGPVEQLLTRAVIWQPDGAMDLVIDVPALRRHLHDGPTTPMQPPNALASLFTQPPPGDRLELTIDDSDRRLLLPISYVRHIADPRPPAQLPRTSPTILGLLSWRRSPIPLLDTARTLGLSPSTSGSLIVAGPADADDALFALTATNVLGVAHANTTSEPLDLAKIMRGLG